MVYLTDQQYIKQNIFSVNLAFVYFVRYIAHYLLHSLVLNPAGCDLELILRFDG